jgi:sugar phosphate isomerase/epimerase
MKGGSSVFTSLHTGAIGLSIPLEEALDLARANDFAALDLSITDLRERADRTSAQEIKDAFGAAGVRPGAWGLPVNFRGDEEVYHAGLAELPRDAALAQEVGSPWCSTWLLPFSDELDAAANMERHVARLRPVAQILAAHGCSLGLEFVGPTTMRAGHAHEFIHTMDGALELAARIETGNVGLLLDCFHWYTAHGTIEDLARLSADQVMYVHLNDARAGRAVDEQIDGERLLPGASGVIDVVAFLQALRRMAYEGPVAVEPFDDALRALPPAARVHAVAESLRMVWARARLPVE